MAGSTVADLVGRVLAGRYRLLAPIGGGASGRVYVADDVRLRRRVAVKVLHSGLSGDAGFLRRFRSEAQLAASLHHPNVMAVYDWGEDGVPFMVLELLAGGSLRSMLDTGTRLTPAQAAHVSGQVAAALEYAHGRGLVHRDIKPANLLFDEHGIVRVADFGLARALAEASWTEPAGAVVGTARYAAPEQGTGAPLDGRADLYALGLVIVESITGSVPLVADTALGTVGLRQDTTLDVPAAVGALTPVVERACAAEPADRYASAESMRLAIEESAATMPPPGPLTLTGLGADGEDPHPTQVVALAPEPALFDQDQPVVTAPARVPVTAARRPTRSRSAAPFLLGAVIAVALSLVAFILLLQPERGSSIPAPRFVGETYAEARAEAIRAKLLWDVERRPADDPLNTVIGQDPAPGEFVRRGSTVTFVVSRGPEPIAMPAVAGVPVADAVAALQAKWAVDTVEEFNDEVPTGTVIRSVPSNRARPDGLVTLYVSKGPPLVAVPNVAGRSYDQAVSRLQARRFEAARADEFSNDVRAGLVIRTEPGPGELVPRGTAVRVVVSKGPDLVDVPDFTGRTITEATVIAAAAGVELEPVGRVNATRKVRDQDPDPGSAKVPRGTTVTIFF
jgi:serine/threonine-protein kinase